MADDPGGFIDESRRYGEVGTMAAQRQWRNKQRRTPRQRAGSQGHRQETMHP
jgi:hypothetical protein